MPNTAHRWTPEEEQAALAFDWPEFSRRYGDLDITHNAWRQRRAYLRKEMANAATPPPPVYVERGEGPEQFIGFSIAYFDFETTYSSQPRLLCGSFADAWGRVETFSLKSHPGEDWLDDGPLADAIARRLEEFDIVVSWNGKLFDVPVINGRLLWHRRPTYEPRLHVDAMYLASGSSARIGRRSLDSVSRFFGTHSKKTPLDVGIWDRADHGSEADYQLILEHCEADVLVLRETFGRLKPQVKNIHR